MFLVLFKDGGRRVILNFIFLFLILIKRTRRWSGSKIFLRDPGMERFSSDLLGAIIENGLWKWGVQVCLDHEWVEFVIVG